MSNPLNKRIPRSLKSEFLKYFVLFLLLTISIALVSGFLVADISITKAYDESFEKYNIEDGNFTVASKMNKATTKRIEEFGITVYENYYKTLEADGNKSYRLYRNRNEVNKVDLLEGRMPSRPGEIALDRMFCVNNSVWIGDTVTTYGGSFTIVGIVALSDYSALFESTTDVMFDAQNFTVGIVSDADFAAFRDITYNYAYIYDTAPVGRSEEKEVSEELSKLLNSEVALRSFTPRYLNQCICFTGEDLGSDRVMMEVLLYIITVILAFVFAVTALSTIQQEQTVIGTLLASGYTVKELLSHYMKLPVTVALVSAVLGNILGYTYFKEICADLYYASYSLVSFKTVWAPAAFVRTTLIPIALIISIDRLILYRKLNDPILTFLRRQTSRKSGKLSLKLSKHIPFLSRFRIRVFLGNVGTYLVMALGIFFANVLLLFGMGLPDILDVYEKEMINNPIAPYITMLSMPESMNREDRKLERTVDMLAFANRVGTEEESAEKFSAMTLRTLADDSSGYKGEDITVYGMDPDTAYIDRDFSAHQIYVSSAYSQKFRVEQGDEIVLKEQFGDRLYSFKIDGVVDYLGGLCLFMPKEDLNTVFDLGEGTFVGYFSNEPITDIDEEYMGTVIDQNALTRISRQLRISFGAMMDLVVWFSVFVYVILIYVLTKIVIDNNAQAISMTKIMGYTSLEISRIYIMASAIIFVVIVVGSIPLELKALVAIFREILLARMSGWLPLTVRRPVFIKLFMLAAMSFAVVGLLEIRKISKVPMDQALKNVE